MTTPKRTAGASSLPPTGRRPVVWIEVDDVLDYFSRHDQPTGIQRVVQELVSAARRSNRPDFRLCRLRKSSGRFEALDLDAFDPLVDWYRRSGRHYQTFRRLHSRLGIWARDIFRLTSRGHPGRRHHIDAAVNEARFNADIRTGDAIFSISGAWLNPGFAAAVAALKSERNVRFVQHVHDLIPIVHADLLDPGATPQFRNWLNGVAPLVDIFLVPSRHVAGDLALYAKAQGWPARPVVQTRFGSGFMSAGRPEAIPRPITEAYALCVGTIDQRKNVGLLVSVWERLVAAHGPSRVPLLVLAGQRGYRSEEVFERLRSSAFASGRVRFMERVSNAVLEALYRHADFTVFPSKAEGWGLPVEESLVHGKPAIVSSATSVPEVGGDLVEYFDPDSVDQAYALIERAIFDPGHLARMTERIQRDFRPRSWTEALGEIVDVIQRESGFLDACRGGERPPQPVD